MCGVIGFMDKLGRADCPSGLVTMAMLDALGCRGPDSAGLAVLRGDAEGPAGWTVRISGVDAGSVAQALDGLGEVGRIRLDGETVVACIRAAPGVTAEQVERALGGRRGGPEVLCLGSALDLVKQVGSPAGLGATYGPADWRGPLAIGHTRMSTESRIDLSHSQPFWAHGVPDLATAHNGHVTNYHRLRRRFERLGTTFYTNNDSEVIGVYLRDRLEQGRSLPEAMADSLEDLDGAYSYLVASPEGLGVVRDRFGFKPLMVAEAEEFVAVATEEVALRRALPGDFRAVEAPPGRATFYPLPVAIPA
ncbi:class II glutamine amidotransferase domain-containing protein [Tautonia plasticadhaerens]|uniref:Amidophosphoribosyltransferase n=1 Tax=Tautonia plasticadhaerens TaxID=2527974 RepID=A0A518H1F0_9BACT|nr:glutamine phosphoribosylpyrophosphate amidotransferase [Tautonia plasticadhaerens]QDV34667.1 Amidophosphoribosyltransferase precursor [Tautonia plasticadhaerens]